MEGKILLKIRYIHREYVEIEIDDPSEGNILDLLVELLGEAEKTGMLLPDHPTLWYTYKAQSFQLENDIDVVNMFRCFPEKKLIDLSVGSADSSYKNLELARGLLESKKGNSIPLSSSHGSRPSSSHKVPTTTARRRGMYVPKVGNTSQSLVAQPISSDLSRTVGVQVEVDVHDAQVPCDDLPDVDVHDVDVSDSATYMLEQGDDGCWSSDYESDYFDRLYENGELYEADESGKIKLKVWMLFADKETLMGVVRDYCVQMGVAVIVRKVEKDRYTTVCRDSDCTWRIHASLLSDKVTWAIKTLDDNHTCLRMGIHNPMATPEWAAMKILEHVRADEDIKGKTIQTFLFEKYGIKLKTTSLYKARELAIEIIKGAADTSYGSVPGYCEGVEPALAKVWHTASRRYCGTHLCANFKKVYPGQPSHDLFWASCKAFSEFKFKKAMEKVGIVLGLGAVQWLQRLGEYECWARHKFDPNLHSPETSSNFVESFNSTLGSDRSLPVLALLEGTRRTIMVRHCMRQEDAQKLRDHDITKHAKDTLATAEDKARSLEVFRVSPTEFEVIESQSSLAVNVEARTCACGEWQISGIPCRHAVRAIRELRGHPEHYVSDWYSVRLYKRTYLTNYRPVPDEEQWPTFDLPRISPPTMKRRVGRPSRVRKRQVGQEPPSKRSRVVQCSQCKAFGHNKKTCKGGLTAREMKEQGFKLSGGEGRKRRRKQPMKNNSKM